MNTLTQVTNFVAILWASEIKSRFCKNSRCSKISKLTLFLAKIISKELSTIGAIGEVKGKTGLGENEPKKTCLKRSSIWINVQARHTSINVPC